MAASRPARPNGGSGFELAFYAAALLVAVGFLAPGFHAFGPAKDFLLVAGIGVSSVLAAVRIWHRPVGPLPGWPLWLAALTVLLLVLLPFQSAASQSRHLLAALLLIAGLGAAFGAAFLSATREEGQVRLLRCWLLIGWLQAVIVLLQFGGLDPFSFLHETPPIWLVYGTQGNPNLVAVLILPLAVLSLDSRLLPLARIRFFSTALLSLALIATGSRGAALLLVAGFGGLYFWSGNRRSRGDALFWGGMVLLLVGAFGVAGGMGKGAQSLEGRIFFWRAAWLLWQRAPWAGHGLGHFEGGYPSAAQELAPQGGAPLALPVQAHNDWLQLAAEGGWIGFLLPVAVLGAVVRAWRQPERHHLAVALGLTGAAACWYAPLQAAATSLLFWTLLGLTTAGTGKLPRPGRWLALFVCLAVFLAPGIKITADRLRAHGLGGRAEAAYAGGEVEQGVQLWQRAWKLAPSEGAFAYGLAWGRAHQGSNGEALVLVREAAKTHANFKRLLLEAALEARQGRPVRALDLLAPLIASYPELREPRRLRSRIRKLLEEGGRPAPDPAAGGKSLVHGAERHLPEKKGTYSQP